MRPASILLTKLRGYLLFALILMVGFSCKFKDKLKNQVSFKNVTGIYYTEVRRAFDSGLAFNRYGYQLSPVWRIMFFSDKQANVYNPDKKIFLNFPVTIDHDSIINVSGTWLKAMKISKDSLKIQVLKVEGKTVYWGKSTVYMTFYADNYIKNVLHKDPEELKKPERRDSLFVLKRIAEVSANPDSFFSAREPAVLKSKSPLLKIVKEKVEADIMNRFDNSDEYMLPEYDITIHKAYENFSYSFLVTVDMTGNLHFQHSMVYIYPEFVKSTTATIKGIIDGYLKAYMQITPGRTLNIPHNSFITLNVEGIKK